MKILVLVSRDPENPGFGGGELVLFRWSELLVQAGHQVEYLCSRFPGSAHEVTVSGVHVVRVGAESTLGLSACSEYLRRFRGKVDVVLEDMLGGARLPFFAPIYVRAPVVSVWFQDHVPLFRLQYPRILLPILTGLERLIVWVHRDALVLVPSSASKISYLSKGGKADRVTIFYPGLPPELLAESGRFKVHERESRVLFLGKLRRYKCPHLAIRAFSLATRDLPEAKMIVAGRPDDERYLAELVRLVRSLGLDEKVSFELGISEERKFALLHTSRVLLSPAPVEGFGIAGLEASACGTPVVGTTGTPTEALREGVNGYRVPFGDEVTMARHTRTLLLDDVVFERLSASAAEFARSFTWSEAGQPLLKILAVLGPRSRE